MTEGLSILQMLQRMMKDLPIIFLEPRRVTGPLPSGAELIGKLTEYEKRLLGVYRQLKSIIANENDSHSHPGKCLSDACLYHGIRVYRLEEKRRLVESLLEMSLRERFALSESNFEFIGDDIYAFEDPAITRFKAQFEIEKERSSENNKSAQPVKSPPVAHTGPYKVH